MKALKISSGLLVVLISMSCSQQSFVDENLSMHSQILDAEKQYAIYLPPGYDRSRREYPILYLLHGARDDQTAWIQFGEVQEITDRAISDGSAAPMIIVMPNAKSGKRGYFNALDGSWNYENFFFEEFIPFIENEYRIRKERQFRAIAGLSMGGGGTFIYALHHAELFGTACPLSANVGPLSFDESLQRNKNRFPEATDSLYLSYYQNYSSLELLDTLHTDLVKSVRWYIDCGDDDFLTEGNCLVHISMKKKGVPHQFRVRDGGHDWEYWRSALPEVLAFASQTFHR